MDYSLLVGVHMFDAEETTRVINSQHEAINASNAGNDAALSKEEKNASLRRAVLAKKLSEVAQANGTAAKRLPRQSSYIADVSQALDLDPELER